MGPSCQSGCVSDICAQRCAGSPISASPYASCFNSPEHSDVLLRVYTDIASTKTSEKSSRSCPSKRNPAPTAAAAPAARSYHCHAVILAVQSGKLKAQLGRSSPLPRTARYTGRRASSNTADAKQTVDVHVEAEELDALHELLRMLYSQTLPAVTPADPAYFQCLKLAERFEAASCMEILIAGLAAAPVEDMDCTVLKEAFQASPGVCVVRSYPALLESCSKALVRLFGDVPTVIRDEALLQQFCSLPYAAVLAWVKSDDLQVHSENCVVFLVSAWVQANQGSTAAQLEELAQHIRVFHLGPAYQHHILPNLSWFNGCSSMQYMPAVLSCIRAGIKMRVGLEAEKDKVCSTASFAFPPGWCTQPRRSSMSSMTCAWVLSPSQLKEVNDGKVLVLPAPVSINGLLMSLRVDQRATDSSAPAPGKTMGLFLGVDLAGMAQRGLPLPDKLLVQLGSPRVVVGCSASEQRKESFLLRAAALYNPANTWGAVSFLEAAASDFHQLVAPYLDAGQLRIEALYIAVDA